MRNEVIAPLVAFYGHVRSTSVACYESVRRVTRLQDRTGQDINTLLRREYPIGSDCTQGVDGQGVGGQTGHGVRLILLALLLLLLAAGVVRAYTLDTEHALYSYAKGIYVFDNRANDGDNIAGTGTMVGTVEDADGFDVPITQTFQSWYNQFGSAYTFCLWHGGWTPGSWSPMIQIHSATDDHSLILSRNGSGAACCLYHQNTQYLFSDLLLTELADPMMFSFTWADSDHVGTAYDGNDVISIHSALVTPKTTCTDAGFAIGGTAMTVTRLYIFSTRLTPAQLGALEADPNSIFIQEEPPAEPPAKATGPSPADDANGVSIPVMLSWGLVEDANNYDVYFAEVAGALTWRTNTDANSYSPFCWPAVEYQWRIDPNNVAGTTTGNVWTFTTAIPAEPNEPEQPEEPEEPEEPEPEEPEEPSGWRNTRQWRRTPAWVKRQGLEGWRKRETGSEGWKKRILRSSAEDRP